MKIFSSGASMIAASSSFFEDDVALASEVYDRYKSGKAPATAPEDEEPNIDIDEDFQALLDDMAHTDLANSEDLKEPQRKVKRSIAKKLGQQREKRRKDASQKQQEKKDRKAACKAKREKAKRNRRLKQRINKTMIGSAARAPAESLAPKAIAGSVSGRMTPGGGGGGGGAAISHRAPRATKGWSVFEIPGCGWIRFNCEYGRADGHCMHHDAGKLDRKLSLGV